MENGVLKLTVIEGPDAGAEYSIAQTPITIGRHSDCHVMLHDASVGRQHCEIRQEGNHFVLHALKSRNGTFINDQQDRVETHRLLHLDRIRVGRSCLQVELPHDRNASPSLSDAPASQELRVENPSDATIVQPVAPLPSARNQQPAGLPLLRVLLQITEGPGTGRTFESHAGMTHFSVGRSPDADFTLEEKAVSRMHFTIEITPSGVRLIDESSLNGTFVNNQRVSRFELHGGEDIRVCTTRMQVQIIGPGHEESKGSDAVAKPERVDHRPIKVSVPDENAKKLSQNVPLVVVPLTDDKATAISPIRRQTIFLAMMMTGLGLAVIVAWIKPLWFARGPLSSAHAPVEGECRTCHPAWSVRSIETTCGVSACHAQVLQGSAQVQDQCTSCHKEHRGRTFLLKGTAEQCWQCHRDGFQNRPMRQFYANTFIGAGTRGGKGELRWAIPTNEKVRRLWLESGPHVETGLRFAHAAHSKSSGVENCLDCHQALPGEIINALGSASAFPSHEECIACHTEVGDRDPRVTTRSASGACRKCHTRDDNRITHEPRSFRYVHFSHDNHKEACATCHATVTTQLVYEPVVRSSFYPLPMEACRSCHEEQHVVTSCVSCHRSHHNYIVQNEPTRSGLERVSLLTIFIVLFTVSAGAVMYNYTRRQRQGR